MVRPEGRTRGEVKVLYSRDNGPQVVLEWQVNALRLVVSALDDVAADGR